MPDSQPSSFHLSPDLQQPLIVEPEEVLAWRTVCLHGDITPAIARSYKAALRTFAMPGAESAPAGNIDVQAGGLSFSEPGFYFFSLPCACVKVLVRKPGLDTLGRCIEIADFISSCTVHSLADFHRVAVGHNYSLHSALAKQFASDQPHAFHCAEVTAFMIYVLAAQGIEAKWMNLGKRGSPNRHVACFVPIGQGGVVLDGDFGVALPFTPEQLLEGGASGFRDAPFVPLGSKRFLQKKHELNRASRSGWTWQPHFASERVTFEPEAYRTMLTELCQDIELRYPVCAPDGGLRLMSDFASEPLVSIPSGVGDPRRSFEESASMVLERCSEAKRELLAAILARVDAQRANQLRAKYGTEVSVLFPRRPAAPIKYLDIPNWLSDKLDLAMRLGLHVSPPMKILDLGTGGGHFLTVCQALGHHALGIDVAVPLYGDIADCLGVRRLIETIEPGKPLTDRGEKFDLVTALWIKFNSLPSNDGRLAYWTIDDWNFLLRDLIDNQMKLPGRIHLELNVEYEDDSQAVGQLNPDLLAMFKRLGAEVDEARGHVTLYCPA